MEVAASAFRHGVEIDDIEHAMRNFVRIGQGSGELEMIVGPARDGRMLEIGIVNDELGPRVVHAMQARRKFWPQGR